MEVYSLEKYPLVMSNSLLLKMTIEIVDLPIENGEMTILFAGWWFQTFFIFHNMGCHPSHWRTQIFQDGYCTTSQFYCAQFWGDGSSSLRWMHQERNAGESKLSANQYKPLELRDAPMGMRKIACDACWGEWMRNHGLLTILADLLVGPPGHQTLLQTMPGMFGESTSSTRWCPVH